MECHNDVGAGPYCVLGSLFLMVFTHHCLRVLRRVVGPGRYEVGSVLLSRKFKLQTTRSSEFMGLSDKISGNANIESDVIVVVIGSGIWPESKSFKTNVLVLLPKGGKMLLKVASLATSYSYKHMCILYSISFICRQNGRNSCANHFSHFHASFSKYLNLDKLANSMGDGTEVLDVQAAAKLLDTRQEKTRARA